MDTKTKFAKRHRELPKLWFVRTLCVLLFFAFLLPLAGCTRTGWTTFQPLDACADGCTCFEYVAPGDNTMREDSEKGEQKRLKMLAKWLKLNGCEDRSYEITSRRPVLVSQNMFGKLYDIHYKVQVQTQ